MRLLVTILSISAVFAYGYALAGLGGFFIGRGSAGYIVWGLLCGTAAGAAALILWRRNITAFYLPTEEQPPAPEDLQNLPVTLPQREEEE